MIVAALVELLTAPTITRIETVSVNWIKDCLNKRLSERERKNIVPHFGSRPFSLSKEVLGFASPPHDGFAVFRLRPAPLDDAGLTYISKELDLEQTA